MVCLSSITYLASTIILGSVLVKAVPTNTPHSVSTTSGPKWTDKDKIVVSIDVPDADNFPMAAYTILSNPGKKVAIVVSGRKVDFGWLNWGHVQDSNSETVMKKILSEVGKLKLPGPAIKYLIQVTSKEDVAGWVTKLPKDAQPWFTTMDENVQDHADVYMEISKIRLVKFLDKLKIPPTRYEIFLQGSATKQILEGIKHAQHVHDWSWDLDTDADAAMKKCKDAKPTTPHDKVRGECISKALKDFIARNHKGQGTWKASEVQGTSDIGSTLDKYFGDATSPYRYFNGGPMTEFASHISKPSAKIPESVAMLQSFFRPSNLLGVQFNHAIDVASSVKSMNAAVDGKLRLFLVPTEISKDSPWVFDEAKLTQAFGASSPVKELAMHFATAAGLKSILFDLITAVYFKHPEIFPPAIKATYSIVNGFVELKPATADSKSELYVVGLGLVKDPASVGFPQMKAARETLDKALGAKEKDLMDVLKKAFQG